MAGGFGHDHQGQCRSIRGNNQIFGQATFQSQPGHTEGAVLVVETGVDRVVAGFRDTPRHAALLAVSDLAFHCRQASLVEQRVFIARHDQHRHQVFEHRTAPREQDRIAAGRRQQTAEGKPAFLRQRALGDSDKAGEAGFRSEQIVIASIATPLFDVVANRQQMAGFVIEKVIIHRSHGAGLLRQAFDQGNPFAGALAGQCNARHKRRKVDALG